MSDRQPGQSKPVRVALMGAPIGIGNRGVSALGTSLVRLILGARQDAEICLLIGHREPHTLELEVEGRIHALPVINHRMSPKARLQQQLWWITCLAFIYQFLGWNWLRRKIERANPWIRAVAAADFVGDIHGGDSFSDIYGLKGFVLDCIVLQAVLWVAREFVLLPQTYGPYRSRTARLLAGHILRRAKVILSRDDVGLAVVSNITGGWREAQFCPDVAFALEAVQPEDPAIEPPLAPGRQRILVGWNVSGLVYNGGFTRDNMFGLKLDYRAFVESLTGALLDIPSVELLLVPHTFAAPGRVESDNEACRLLARAVPAEHANRVHLVTAEYDQYRIKGVIGMCEFFIGSRMHACIAALSQGIPTVGVAYSRKFLGVFSSVGAGDWVVDGREVGEEEAVRRVVELFQQRQALAPMLREKVASAQQVLRKTFEALLTEAPS